MNQLPPRPFFPDLFELPGNDSESGRLIGMRCEDCRKTCFPGREWCPACFGQKLGRVPLSKKGTLYTFTVCRMSLPHLKAPYVIGYVDLPEGVRVFSILDVDVGAGHAPPLRIGMPMALTFGQLRMEENGQEVWCYKFRPHGEPS
ncbi:MAG: OB-fold domain-containing protein [Nitrospirae bacterium]|nr:OB-fold domain-containing protein [Nitrospirota bacterium]